ncbi:MAG TPA: hypothetical protein VMS54_06870 [Vicinamibacterales bacterium]|nr:hypothetical protein [Vicinamibacterales bacterium]
MRLSRRFVPVLLLTLFLTGSLTGLAGTAPPDLPEKLTDQEFWTLTETISEPNGVFQSDNLLSNEIVFARMVPDLVASTKPGGVYLGVGPEQNFTYIAAIRPKMAFITDIRRGNLHVHLMYKALFELSKDRAEFVSRLFTKPRPAGLAAGSSVADIMNAYWDVTTSDEAAYNANLAAIHAQLTTTHRLPLSADDLAGIARVYRTFYWYGPAMTYAASTSLTLPGAGRGTTYSDLMTQRDANGQGLSYLGSEEKFLFLKDLERRNLVVPVVGDFTGPKALRAVGAYIRDHGATVTAFYLSNVEQYLRRANTWQAFCSNVATFPLDDASLFIRPSGSTFVFVNGQLASGATGQPVVVTSGTATAAGRLAEIRLAVGAPTGATAFAGGLVPIAPEVKNCGG